MTITLNGTTGITTPALTNSGALTQTGAATLSSTLQAATTIGVGGATPSASGAGITFPATASASSDANTLDDYEEGSYTPVITGGSSNPTVTYANQVGKYTKIGKVVQFVAWVQLSNVSGGSGDLQVSLPFTAATGAVYYQSTSCWFQNMAFPNAFAQGLVNPATNYFWLSCMVNSKTSGYANVNISNLSTTTEIRVAGSYLVD